MGHDYKIVWKPKGSVKAEGPGGKKFQCYGLTDEATQTIQMEDGNPPSLERSTLLHEVFHQMINSSSALDIDGELEERIAEFLGETFTSHIRDNPAFWRYVTAPIKDQQE
jgi:hypothetical protein